MNLRVLPLAAACLLLASACATTKTSGTRARPTAAVATRGASATPTSIYAPGIAEPPAAFLVAPEGRDVRGAAGTRCWENVCADFVATVTNVEPFLLHTGSSYTLRFDDPQPDHVEVTWSKASADVPPVENGRRLWMSPSGGAPVEVSAGHTPDTLGDYVVEVFAQWQSQNHGDASYGFYVAVR